MMNIANSKSIKRKSIIVAVVLIVLGIAMAVAAGIIFKNRQDNNHDKQMWDQHAKEAQLNTADVTPEMRDKYQTAPNKPRYINIPKIKLDKVRVIEVGLTNPNRNGEQQIDAPKGIHDAGWFNCKINDRQNSCDKTTYPEENDTNNAVLIDGHSCSGRGCVFDHIDQLKLGDKIDLVMGDNKTISYKVVTTERVKLQNLDIDKLLRPVTAGKAGMNLITCAGTWSMKDTRGVRSMDQRVIVYTEKL